MVFDLQAHLEKMDRKVTSGTRDGQDTVIVHAARTYATDALDLWDAVTTSERLTRWFLPISGDLREGGNYQFQGNAGGKIQECTRPERVRVTWEHGGGVSWLTLRLVPESNGTRLELEHEAPVMPGFSEVYGPGAVGVGWDMGFMGLAQHLADPDANPAAEARAGWETSQEAKDLYRVTSEAWGRADAEAGTPAEQAAAGAEATRQFYSGETPPGA